MSAAPAVLTSSADHAAALTRSLTGRPLLVVALCAAWCDTCTEFRATFERIAQTRPDTSFVWLDIEDDAELAGDIEVENFPTLAVYRDSQLLHFGISLPQQGIVTRLLDGLQNANPQLNANSAMLAQLPSLLQRHAMKASSV